MKKLFLLIFSLILIITLTACGIVPQVKAEDRLFLKLSLTFLDDYQLPKQIFEATPVGGLSALTYDRQANRFYALSDDHSQKAPARFYTLDIPLTSTPEGQVKIENIAIIGVTFLKNQQGQPYPPNQIDPEGLALSPRGSVFISSEGVTHDHINPFIGEFDLKSGQLLQTLRLPQRYLLPEAESNSPRGVRDNLGFEALTLSITSLLKDDPFRLFTATEASLTQDIEQTSQRQIPTRWLHYVISSVGEPVIVAEHLYLLDAAPKGTIFNGLTDIIALEREGYWLSLERTFGLSGSGAKLFEVVNSNSTDTSRITSFQGDLVGISPLKKKLVLDLAQLGIKLDNLEGMTLGPRLSDGTRTLLLVSDDNFNQGQVTQFLLFRLASS